jgi:hypothetical protein
MKKRLKLKTNKMIYDINELKETIKKRKTENSKLNSIILLRKTRYRKHSLKVTVTLSGVRIILHPYYFIF